MTKARTLADFNASGVLTSTSTLNPALLDDTGTIPSALLAGVGGDNTPSFGATASSTQSISQGSFEKVVLNTENWDTAAAFDSSSTYRFTVPSGEGGEYVFNYGAYLVSMTTNGYFQLQLYKNGAELRESAQRAYMSSTATASMNVVGSITTPLSAGDYIEFYVIQGNTDGGGGTRTLSDSNYKPFLTGFKIA
tara:strand:+ start:262 stop:840 length:579 start_codon:yes stop_codon:yes gene_type:complete